MGNSGSKNRGNASSYNTTSSRNATRRARYFQGSTNHIPIPSVVDHRPNRNITTSPSSTSITVTPRHQSSSHPVSAAFRTAVATSSTNSQHGNTPQQCTAGIPEREENVTQTTKRELEKKEQELHDTRSCLRELEQTKLKSEVKDLRRQLATKTIEQNELENLKQDHVKLKERQRHIQLSYNNKWYELEREKNVTQTTKRELEKKEQELHDTRYHLELEQSKSNIKVNDLQKELETLQQDHVKLEAYVRKNRHKLRQKVLADKETETETMHGDIDKTLDVLAKSHQITYDIKVECNAKLKADPGLHRGKVLANGMQLEHFFVKPFTKLPPAYVQKDVYVPYRNLLGADSLLPLKPGDHVQFELARPRNGSENGTKPSAHKAKILNYSATRSLRDIIVYFEDSKERIEDTKTRTSVLNDIMIGESSEALWTYLLNFRVSSSSCYEKYLIHLLILIRIIMKYSLNFPARTRKIFSYISDNKILDKLTDPSRGVQQLKMDLIEKLLLNNPSGIEIALPILRTLKDSSHETQFFYKVMLKIAGQIDLSSWKDLTPIPRIEEILGDPLEKVTHLKSVVMDRPYKSTDEYLDVYYRLLRAETFTAIQKGIHDLKVKGNQFDDRDMNVYLNVQVKDVDVEFTKILISLKFSLLKPVSDWRKSRKLMFGNLLCLSVNGEFTDPIWATVSNRDDTLLQKENVIAVELITFDQNADSTSKSFHQLIMNSGSMVMVESPTYYQSFRHVLDNLKYSQLDNFHLVDQIVFGKYSELSHPVQGSITERRKLEKQLEKYQLEAFNFSLKSSLAIIQGPPGTGKTYVGTKIVQYLLSDQNSDSPIILLTYKNHALDEFLKHTLEFCDAAYLTRLGGQSKEPKLEQCLLRNKMKDSKFKREPTKQYIEQINELFNEFSVQLAIMDKSKTFDIFTFIDNISYEQLQKFLDYAINPQTVNMIFHQNSWINLKPQITNDVLSHILRQPNLTLELLDEPNIAPNAQKRMKVCIERGFSTWLPNKKNLLTLMELQRKGSTFFRESVSDDNNVQPDDGQDMGLDDLDDDYIQEMKWKRMSAFYDVDDSGKPGKRKHSMIQSANKSTNPNIFEFSDFPLGCSPNYNLLTSSNLLEMTDVEKYSFIYSLLVKDQSDVYGEINSILDNIELNQYLKKEADDRNKLKVLDNMKIIGATITGASMHLSLLKKLFPKIVIVEEAAEILEPSLIACLSESVEHLILIGDHKQLHPSVDTYYLRREHNLHISLMERLINLDFPFQCLKKQGRMRPEFSSLLHDIYPGLLDFPNLRMKNKPILCMPHTLFFWSHKFPEIKDRSVRNPKEANMAVAMALFFITCNVKPSDITILCSYLGHVQEVKKLYRSMVTHDDGDDNKSHIEIRTIDEYQGDENEYVIVSLARSNNHANIGFLKEKERRCVAQSRAKCGLYFVGNADLFRRFDTWRGIIECLDASNLVNDSLPINCIKHPDKVFSVKQSNDLLVKKQDQKSLMFYVNNQQSWCTEVCKDLYPCEIESHRCSRRCTPYHKHELCKSIVSYIFPKCGHRTTKECSKDGTMMECRVMKKCALSCGHVKEIECFVLSSDLPIKCTEPCKRKYNCEHNHKCDKSCGTEHTHNNSDCTTMIEFNIPKCGHTSTFLKKCGAPISTTIKCKQQLHYTSEKCNHLIKRHCHEAEKCQHPCKKLRGDCGHPCQLKCSQLCTEKGCKECLHLYEQSILECKQDAKKKLEDYRKVSQLNRKTTFQVLTNNSTEYNSAKDKVSSYLNLKPSSSFQIDCIAKVNDVKNTEKYYTFIAEDANGITSEELYCQYSGSTNAANLLQSIGNSKTGFKFTKHASNSSKRNKNVFTLIIADMLVGEMIEENNELLPKPLTFESLNSIKKDSVQRRNGNGPTQYTVYNPAQILLKYKITLSVDEVDAKVEDPLYEGPDGISDKIDIKKFNFRDVSNPFCEHLFRAKTRYDGGCMDRKSYAPGTKMPEITHVRIVVNHAASSAYDKRKSEIKRGVKEIFAFHATDHTNVESIAKSNLNPNCKVVNGRRYGDGSYFSEFPEFSKRYGGAMFIFKVMLAEGHYKKYAANKEGFCEQIVIEDAAFFKPLYVLYFS